MTVERYDAAREIESPKRLDNGWLRTDGRIARAGILVYRNPDGTERREFRPPEEVFKADSLATFSLVPVTNDHPPEGLLTAANTKQHAVGHLGESVRQDGEFVKAPLFVTDAAAITSIESGKRQLSAGYRCDLEMVPGAWRGHRYDAVQRNIRANHVAIVDRGRAGPEVSIRLDGEDVIVDEIRDDQEKESHVKTKINGIEFEITEQVAQAIERERADAAEKLQAAEKLVGESKERLDAERARADAAEKAKDEADKARQDAADPAKLQALIAARVSLETEARRHLGEAKLDALDDRAVMVRVVEKLDGDKLADDEAVAYVKGRFDAAVKRAAKTNPSLDRARQALARKDADKGDEERMDAESARARMVDEHRNRWQQPLDGSATK